MHSQTRSFDIDPNVRAQFLKLLGPRKTSKGLDRDATETPNLQSLEVRQLPN